MNFSRTFGVYALALSIFSCQPSQENAPEMKLKVGDYSTYPTYTPTDLGITYTTDHSTLRVWAPSASEVKVRLYKEALHGSPLSTHSMKKDVQGTWAIQLEGNQHGIYYTIQTKVENEWQPETPDPYATAAGTNGKRACILDLSKTNPQGWAEDQKPKLASKSDIILYELHVRDLSIHPQSGIEQKGKFLGLTETGTKGPNGVSTGLDHIKSLGITHVHLLPSFDYASIDESKLDSPAFNWGYDPVNYNVPEGSYSTDPSNAATRIKEFKQLVKTLHANGLRVIMDVVYNHTFSGEDSPLNRTVPGYYYRQNEDGSFSNASGCGNETASERSMMRKYMIESLKFWVEEYHIDGFRFDLMAIHDMETMNQISQELHAIEPSIFLYGEGWTAGSSPLPAAQQASKKDTYKLDRIAAFSDDLRDGVKGSWHDIKSKGFATGSGNVENKEKVKFGIAGNIKHPQIDHSLMPYLPEPWAGQPTQAINYVSCHDNHTLWDRIAVSNEDEYDEEERTKMHLLSNTIVFTSQAIPFLHAGGEFLRTKGGEENSYNKPDAVNQLDWNRKSSNLAIVEFYQKLIALRKNHPAFRMPTQQLIQEHLQFEKVENPNIIAYSLIDHANGDTWKEIKVYFNGGDKQAQMSVPKGSWNIVLQGNQINEEGIGTFDGGMLDIPSFSAIILAQ